MTAAKIALLEDRGVVSVTGGDAHKFLQGLVTNDVDLWPWLKQPPVPPAMGGLIIPRGAYAALLSPQGKILFDFIVRRGDEQEPSGGFIVDVAASRVVELIQRLSMYRLRADVKIVDESKRFSTYAVWGGDESSFDDRHAIPDPRVPELGQRLLLPTEPDNSSSVAALLVSSAHYHAHRISLGIPEGGRDYAWGEVFPHEANFDHLNGVSFTKGCYVGQEIVARMEHRATTRRRIIRVTADAPLPPKGTEIRAGDVAIGQMGSFVTGMGGGKPCLGLAMLRLDRVAEFAAQGVPLTAGGVRLVPDQLDLVRLLPQSRSALEPK